MLLLKKKKKDLDLRLGIVKVVYQIILPVTSHPSRYSPKGLRLLFIASDLSPFPFLTLRWFDLGKASSLFVLSGNYHTHKKAHFNIRVKVLSATFTVNPDILHLYPFLGWINMN